MALGGTEVLRDRPHDTALFARIWDELREPDQPREAQDPKLIAALTEIALLDAPTRVLVDGTRTVLDDATARLEWPRSSGQASVLLDSMLEDSGFYDYYGSARIMSPVARGVGVQRPGVLVQARYTLGAVGLDAHIPSGVVISERLSNPPDWATHDIPLLADGRGADPIETRVISDALRSKMSEFVAYALDLSPE